MRFALNGVIVSDEDATLIRWCGLNDLYRPVCPQDVRDAIAQTPAGEELIIEVNSGGGQLYNGFEIYSVLQGAQCPTRAEIQSIAGSAASVACVGADTVSCTAVGQVMIHLPSIVTEGNEPAHKQSIGLLRAATDSIINAYAAKCGDRITRDALRAKMAAETFLTAQQALEIGLVDEIIGAGSENITPAQVYNSMGGWAACGVLPDLSRLRAAYAAAHAPGGAHEEPDIERVQAQLALELARII